jgi:hypothetical protein
MFKKLKKLQKAFVMLLVLLVSGLIPTGLAIAGELVATVEFEAKAFVEVQQGDIVDFNISLTASGNNNATFNVDTNYFLNEGKGSSNSPSSIGFNGANNVKNISAILNVSKDTPPGIYSVPIKVLITQNHDKNTLTNNVIDYIFITVLPRDSVAPLVTVTNPINGMFYQSSQLPELPEITVSEDYTNPQFSAWSKEEGTHKLTVSVKDLAGNVGISSETTYTVDNTKPLIETLLVTGGVYKSSELADMVDSYYSITEPHLEFSSADELNLEPGEHTVKITAEDKAGNQAEKVITYIIDNDAPTITFNFTNGGYYTSEVFRAFNKYYDVIDDNLDVSSIEASEASLTEDLHSVTVSASDLAGNFNSATASYTIDNTVPVVTINLENNNFYNQTSLSEINEFYTVYDRNHLHTEALGFGSTDGTYNATVTATDKAGNSTTETVTYHVDTTAPVITIDPEKLANGGFYQSSYLENLKDFYSVSEVNLDFIKVGEFNYENGTHTFTITATDKAGNSTTETVSYTVDNIFPIITFNLNNNGFYKSSSLPENYFSASDNNDVLNIVAGDYGKSEGTYTLTVTAVDAAGNRTTGTITYTVDDTAPVVTITSPVNDGVYKSSDLPEEPVFSIDEENKHTSTIIGWNTIAEATHTVTVTATDAAGNIGQASVTYTVDNTAPQITSTLVENGVYNADTLEALGQYYTVTDPNLEEDSVKASPLELEEGTYTAVITAVDKAGNEAKKVINYIVDNTAPEITFTYTDEGHYTSSAFRGKDPFYKVEDANLDKSTIEANGLSFTEGEHTLTVSASDLAGNSNTQSATYTIDDTQPVITLSIENGRYYTLEALEALGQYWSVKDDNPTIVNASRLETINGSYTATVTATDKAGNITIVSVQYHVDNTPPEIVINEDILKDGGFYNAEYLKGITKPYKINDANPSSDIASELILSEGTHEFTITAIDKAGNKTIKTISYNVDNTAPTISFKIMENGFYTTATLEEIGQYYSANDNNQDVTVFADPLKTGEDGTYTLEVTATDKAGNSKTESITYTVDDTSPVVKFHLTPGKHYTTKALNEALAEKESYYSATDQHLASVVGEKLQTSEGVHTLTVTAIDKAGNETVSSITFTIDDTAPVINGLQGLVNGQRFLVGQEVDVTPVVNDNLDADLTVESTKLDTSKAGAQAVTITATDKAGNTSTFEYSYHVYNYSGVLQPVKADGSSTFKKNSTVPVKFQIADGSLSVKDATATIQIVKITNNVAGEPVDGISTSAASEGNLFRYETSDNHYIFNLGTKALEEGQYKALITVTIDGVKVTKESQTFSIRK